MNKEIEELKVKLNKKLENYELDKAFGQLSVDSIYSLFPNESKMLLDYINQLEEENEQLKANRDEVIEYIKNENLRIIDISKEIPELCDRELLSLLERGKE